jgi:hypothetical protein
MYEFQSSEECKAAKKHGTTVDCDGYCNLCGDQNYEAPPIDVSDSVKRYLDVSTGNLPADEFVALKGHEKVIYREHPYGAWVWVPSDDGDDTHDVTAELPALAALFVIARENNCSWINFDQDAELLAGAPNWEW